MIESENKDKERENKQYSQWKVEIDENESMNDKILNMV